MVISVRPRKESGSTAPNINTSHQTNNCGETAQKILLFKMKTAVCNNDDK